MTFRDDLDRASEWADAYLQRVGLLPRRRPTLTQLVAGRAAARAGVLDSS